MCTSKWRGVLLAAAFCLGAPAFSQGDDDKPRLPSMRRVAVPGAVGKTWNDAKAILAGAGLSYKSSTLVINPGKRLIGAQSPAAAALVPAGTVVVLTVK